MKYLHVYISILLVWASSLTMVSCDNEEEPESEKDLIELIVNKPVIRAGQNKDITLHVVVGNGNYTVYSYDSEIATATVEGEQINIHTGSKNGATTVEVTDQDGMTAVVSVNVGVFELEINLMEPNLEVGEEKELIVTMGNFSSNEELNVTVADETVVHLVNTDPFRPYYLLKGLKAGNCKITFTDQLGKTAEVEVTVNPNSIDVSNLTPKVGVNNKIQITVEKGNGGYTMEAENPELVTIKQLDAVRFSLIGKQVGETRLIVRDQAQQELALNLTVTLADKVASLGDSNYFTVPFTLNGVADESLKNMSTITFETRFYINSLNGSGDAYINTLLGIEKRFLLRVDVRKNDSNTEKRFLQLAADDKGSIRYEGTTQIEVAKWYNVAVVLDETKSGDDRIALYVNGEKETFGYTAGNTADLKNIDLTNNFFIAQSDGKRRLSGSMSYVRIWDKALTGDEIKAQNGFLLEDSSIDGLVADWVFNNGNGNVKTFVSLTDKSFEAEASSTVISWVEDPGLK